MLRRLAILFLCVLAGACGSSDDAVGGADAAATDTGVAPADASRDTRTEGTPPTDQGKPQTDDGPALVDAAADDAAEADASTPPAPCEGIDLPAPANPIGAEQKRFALGVYHFNLQYVAGGLRGSQLSGPVLDLDNDEVEDRIITESFEPIVDLYAAHPEWGADVELQGYMLDVMVERHPAVLAKLRALAESGHIGVQSWHWSDQLWVAYGPASMEASARLNRRSFEDACVPPSPVVFTQEGQFSESFSSFGRPLGLEGALLPKNLLRYFHASEPFRAAYDLDGLKVLVGGRSGRDEANDVEVRWTFMDDGELAMTGDLNPYLGEAFALSERAAAEHEAHLQSVADDGYQLVRVIDYLRTLDERGADLPPLPPVPDGTWQPDNTENVRRWMGAVGGFGETEDDNGVLTANAVLEHRLVAIAAWIDELDPTDGAWRSLLDAAWAEALLAQVSDATGWNPVSTEVAYSREHGERAHVLARALVEQILDSKGLALVVIDPLAAKGERAGPLIPEGDWTPVEVEAPVAGVVADGSGWDASVRWTELRATVAGAVLDVRFDPDPAVGSNRQELRFPWDGEALTWSPALDPSTLRELPISVLDPHERVLCLPQANGLTRLSSGVYALKIVSSLHLAACFDLDEGVLFFRDESAHKDATVGWRLHVLTTDDEEEALAYARRINVAPITIEPRD